MSFLKVCWAQYKDQRKKQRESQEKAAIAKSFNDRYTYRIRYDTSDVELIPGNDMYGFRQTNGYRWMCPECNTIHRPTQIDAFVGLHYPRCCSRFEGHRLNEGIKHS